MTLTANTAILTTTSNVGANPTTGNLTAGADTINATNMLAATTVIQDATANDGDVLNITANANQGAPIIQNIETINLTSFGATLDFASITGNTTLNVVAGSTATTLTNLSDAKAINVGSGNTGVLSAGLFSSTAATDSVVVNLAGTATGFGLTTTSAIDNVTVNASANSSLSAGVNLAAGTNTATSTFKLAGAGNITLGAMTWNGDVRVIDATGLSGNLTYTAVANDTVNGGTGADALTVATTVATTLNGNGGNDSFTVTGGVLTNATTIAGGEGTDTINLISVAGGTHNFANVSTVESVVLTKGASDIPGNTTLTFGNTTSSSTLTVNASTLGTGYNVAMGNAQTANVYTMSITGGAGADTLSGGQLADTIIGGNGADVITGGAGIDTIDLAETTPASDTVKISVAGANGVDRAIITGFTAGVTNGDVFNFNSGVATLTGTNNFAGAASLQTVAATGNLTALAATEVVVYTAATIADVTSAGSLNGTNLLTAIGGTVTANANSDAILIAVGIAGGGTAIYYAADAAGDGNTTYEATEITLVGVLNGVAVADLMVNNFANAA